MKFPKLRDGPTAIGESFTRQLSGVDAPFLKKSNGDGTIGYTRNGFPEVHQSEVTDGYYCLGDLTGSAPFYISASSSGKGTFGNRGIFDKDNSYGFAAPNLFYVGRGFAVVPQNPSAGVVRLYKTFDGKTFAAEITYSFSFDGFVPLSFNVTTGAQHLDSGTLKHSYGFSRLLVTDPVGLGNPADYVYSPLYSYFKDAGWYTGAMLAYPGEMNGMPLVHRVGPQKLVALTGVYGTSLATPYPFFSVSLDNGATWNFVDSAVFFSSYVTSPPNVNYNADTGRTVSNTMVRPETPTTCIALVPFPSAPGDLTGVRYHAARIDLAAFTITDLGTMPFNATAPYYGTLAGTQIMLGKRMFFQLYDQAATAPHLLASTLDGVTWTYTLMPMAGYLTGFVMAINATTLVCPMFDGQYSLYQSVDLGVTWTRRATIRSNTYSIVSGTVGAGGSITIPAPTTAQSILPRFSSLSYLRREDSPAPTFPGAPWVGNERIAYTP